MTRLDRFIGLPPTRPYPRKDDPSPEYIRAEAEKIKAANLETMRKGENYMLRWKPPDPDSDRARWAREHVEAGLCSQCNAEQVPGLTMCEKHIEAQRQRQRRAAFHQRKRAAEKPPKPKRPTMKWPCQPVRCSGHCPGPSGCRRAYNREWTAKRREQEKQEASQ